MSARRIAGLSEEAIDENPEGSADLAYYYVAVEMLERWNMVRAALDRAPIEIIVDGHRLVPTAKEPEKKPRRRMSLRAMPAIGQIQ